jgi:hypothetical protein
MPLPQEKTRGVSMWHRWHDSNCFVISIVGLCLSLSVFTHGSQQANDGRLRESIPIIVSPYGFVQKAFSLPAGMYLFVVLNRSGYEDINVYLERMPRNNLTDTPTQQEFGDTVGATRVRLVRSVKLESGTYRLRVANRPDWICGIQVH